MLQEIGTAGKCHAFSGGEPRAKTGAAASREAA
jgi:hypothetical protein